MSKHNTVKSRYKGNWKNVQDDCMLCEMEKRTEWHIETPQFVIVEKLSGGPFIVSKRHETQLSDEKRNAAERLVSLLYDDYELRVVMGMVKDHWHAHIVTDDDIDLSNE